MGIVECMMNVRAVHECKGVCECGCFVFVDVSGSCENEVVVVATKMSMRAMRVCECICVSVRRMRRCGKGCVLVCSVGLGKGGEKDTERVLSTFQGKHGPWYFPNSCTHVLLNHRPREPEK